MASWKTTYRRKDGGMMIGDVRKSQSGRWARPEHARSYGEAVKAINGGNDVMVVEIKFSHRLPEQCACCSKEPVCPECLRFSNAVDDLDEKCSQIAADYYQSVYRSQKREDDEAEETVDRKGLVSFATDMLDSDDFEGMTTKEQDRVMDIVAETVVYVSRMELESANYAE